MECPQCGNTLRKNGFSTKKQRWRCDKCNFSCVRPLSPEELMKIDRKVLKILRTNLKVKTE